MRLADSREILTQCRCHEGYVVVRLCKIAMIVGNKGHVAYLRIPNYRLPNEDISISRSRLTKRLPLRDRPIDQLQVGYFRRAWNLRADTVQVEGRNCSYSITTAPRSRDGTSTDTPRRANLDPAHTT